MKAPWIIVLILAAICICQQIQITKMELEQTEVAYRKENTEIANLLRSVDLGISKIQGRLVSCENDNN